MRDVDHHTEPVHFADDVLAKRGQAVVRRLVGRGIGPVVVLEVRQRHIANAERGEVPQLAHVVVDHVPALDAHQRRDLLLGGGTPDLGGSRGQHEIVGMSPHGFANGVDLIVGTLHRDRTGDIAGHPDREEQPVHPAVLHARDVDVAVAVALADVEARIEDHALRGIGVGIDDDRAAVNGGRLRLAGGERGNGDESESENEEAVAFHAAHLT